MIQTLTKLTTRQPKGMFTQQKPETAILETVLQAVKEEKLKYEGGKIL